jgi:hypothetical protein
MKFANEGHKWMAYFIWAVIITIFGLVIYIITQNNDKYYFSLTVYQDESTAIAPAYPDTATGTLQNGVAVFRNALVTKLDALGVNYKVAPVGQWKFSAAPMFLQTGETNVSYVYRYSFPCSAEMKASDSLLETTINSIGGVTALFSDAPTAESNWATTTFGDPAVRGIVTYGSRDPSNASTTLWNF